MDTGKYCSLYMECGCCYSPWVKFKYRGKLIVESDEFNFTMIKEEFITYG